MSELDEISGRFRQLTVTLFSAALATAQAAQMLRERKARDALRATQQEQANAARQLRADRAAAALLWNKALDPRLTSENPEQLAQAWASAAAWETLDSRAALTTRRLDARLRAAGVHPDTAQAARGTDDYAALALLLARASDSPTTPRGSGTDRQRDPAEMIHTALDPALAEEVLASKALPALMDLLDRAGQAGHDPARMLAHAARRRGFEDAWDPAAVLHYRVGGQLAAAEAGVSDTTGHPDVQLADDATRDRTGADHDLADADAQRWAQDTIAEIATDPGHDPATQAGAVDASHERAAAAERLEGDAAALTARAQDTATTTAAGGTSAPGAPPASEMGFTGGSPIARLAAESYPHSIHTALACAAGAPQRLIRTRHRAKGHNPEQDHGR